MTIPTLTSGSSLLRKSMKSVYMSLKGSQSVAVNFFFPLTIYLEFILRMTPTTLTIFALSFSRSLSILTNFFYPILNLSIL